MMKRNLFTPTPKTQNVIKMVKQKDGKYTFIHLTQLKKENT